MGELKRRREKGKWKGKPGKGEDGLGIRERKEGEGKRGERKGEGGRKAKINAWRKRDEKREGR